MKWIALKVIFDAAEPALVEELVSAVFLEEGLSGVVIEQPDMEPVEGWGDDAEAKPVHHSVTGYIAKNEEAVSRCAAVKAAVGVLASDFDFSFRIQEGEMDEEDWAESWKAFFWPEKVSDTIVVKPTWREYTAAPGEIILEIDPGMAFGTGTHPTTALCVRMIESYLKPGMDVLDVGTGSGILLMAAGVLGAGRLVGVDNDAVAVTVAGENLSRNGIGPDDRTLLVGNLVDAVQETFDLVVANILAETVVDLIPDIRKVTARGGRLIFSGIIEEKAAMVEAAMVKEGFLLTETRVDGGWVVVVGEVPA